jgi:aldehyde dehydrogenase (NAD+)
VQKIFYNFLFYYLIIFYICFLLFINKQQGDNELDNCGTGHVYTKIIVITKSVNCTSVSRTGTTNRRQNRMSNFFLSSSPLSSKVSTGTWTFLQRREIGMVIDGASVPSLSGNTMKIMNPSDGTILARLAKGTAEDVDRAVSVARRAFETGWCHMVPAQREMLLRNFARSIEEHKDELAELESLDNGKPIHHTRAIDVRASAGNLYHAAGIPTKISGTTPAVSIPDHFVYTKCEPLGVVGIILPWNYPLIHAMQKAGPAMACGNTVVLKPASEASLAVVRLGELAMEAGLPAGVLNIITGPGSVIGKALSEHPGIDKIQMTGSTEIGKNVIAASTGNIKRLALELGSKAPDIIFADADLSRAVPGVFEAAFGHSGQSCVAGCRLFVQRPVFEQVKNALVAMTAEVRPGHALDDKTTMGPIVSKNQYDTIMGYIRSGQDQGATLLCGGKRIESPAVPEGGYYIEPTIFTNVPDDAVISVEEIFGPVVNLYVFDTEDEVVRRANHTTYGLAAGVWTTDVSRAHRVAHALQSGVVWVNTYDKFQPTVPFGGYKQSGYGRDNSMSAIEAFTETKSVWVYTGA